MHMSDRKQKRIVNRSMKNEYHKHRETYLSCGKLWSSAPITSSLLGGSDTHFNPVTGAARDSEETSLSVCRRCQKNFV